MSNGNGEKLRGFVKDNRLLFYPLVWIWRLVRLPCRLLCRATLKLDALERMVSEDKVLVVQSAPYTAGKSGAGTMQEFTLELRRVFRGRDHVKDRHAKFIKHIRQSCADTMNKGFIMDVSSGRGDFLSLLKEAGIKSKGVEEDETAYKRLKAEGFDMVLADPAAFLEDPAAFLEGSAAFLEGSAAGSIAGVSAFHFTEHRDHAYMQSFLALAHDKIAPGGLIMLECSNPKNRVAACNFYFDSTRVVPYPPEILKFMVEWAGFKNIKTVYSCPASPKFRVEGAQECNYENFVVLGYKEHK